MTTRHNLKEPYFQAKTPLLDEDFDLYAPEVIDLIQAIREMKNTDSHTVEPKSQNG